MGHNITAYRPNVDRDSLYVKYQLDLDDTDNWLSRYAQYREETQIAYLRRSAGNPMNQVIYLALGTIEAYAGCSGDGSTLQISLEQFKTAREILKVKSFENLKLERNVSHEIVEYLQNIGMTVIQGIQDFDPDQEADFVVKCINYMELYDLESLSVTFA